MSSTEQLHAIASSTDFPPSVLALCADGIRLQRLLEHLIHLCGERHGFRKGEAPEVRRVNAAELNKQTWRALKEDLTALSLFSKHTLTRIERVEKLSAEFAKELITIAADLPSSSTVLLSGSSLPANSSLLKFFRSKKWIVELEDLKGADLTKWVQKELKTQGGFTQGDASVPGLLVDLGEESPDTIARLISVLSLYCENARVGTDDVKALFPDRVHGNEFQLVDALIRGDQKVVLEEVDNLARLGKSPLSLLGLLARNLNTLLSIVSLKQRGLSEPRIREQLGIPEWLFRKHIASAAGLDAAAITRATAALLRADSKFKNASLGDEAVLTELFDRMRPR